jgi:hypothetical protein
LSEEWQGLLRAPEDSVIISRFTAKRDQMDVRVLNALRLRPTEHEQAEFIRLNQRRISRGLVPQYAAERFRLVSVPSRKGATTFFETAPFSFVTFAVLRDQEIPAPGFVDSVQHRLNAIGQKMKRPDPGTPIDGMSLAPLGLEVAIITSDGKTLLRRRGASVQTEKGTWDVGISGYVGQTDYDHGRAGRLDLTLTAQRELKHEIGAVDAHPADLTFLGLHLNKITGATDVLASWRIGHTARQLAGLIGSRYPGSAIEFETTKRSIEQFVWDTRNVFIDFNPASCIEATKAFGRQLMPEASICLQLALNYHLG